MENRVHTDIALLLEKTEAGEVNWNSIPNTNCLTTKYNEGGVIICRYRFQETKELVVGFFFFFKYNKIILEFNKILICVKFFL
jgi:hypothetical protein